MRVDKPTLSDRDIHAAVEAELDGIPEVNRNRIGVVVDEGVVTLSGEVHSHFERIAARNAATRVREVTAVVNHINVHPPWSVTISETDIGKEVLHALRAATNVPDTVKAEIDGHTVTLTGHAAWDFQRRAARRAVQDLCGVQSVNDLITLTARVSTADNE